MGNINRVCREEQIEEERVNQTHDATEIQKLGSYRQINLMGYVKTVPTKSRVKLRKNIISSNLIILDHVY